jgi:hypothetical protein
MTIAMRQYAGVKPTLNFICTLKREAQHSTLGPVTEYGMDSRFSLSHVDKLPLVMFVPRSTTF